MSSYPYEDEEVDDDALDNEEYEADAWKPHQQLQSDPEDFNDEPSTDNFKVNPSYPITYAHLSPAPALSCNRWSFVSAPLSCGSCEGLAFAPTNARHMLSLGGGISHSQRTSRLQWGPVEEVVLLSPHLTHSSMRPTASPLIRSVSLYSITLTLLGGVL